MDVEGARITVARADRAAACPDAARLKQALAPLDIVRKRGDALSIHIEIEPMEGGFAALIRVSGEQSGVRDLRSPGADCSQLEADLTASLALLLDQRSTEATTEPPPEEEPAPPASARTPSVEPPPRPPPRSELRPAAKTAAFLEWRVNAGAGAALLLVGPTAPAFAAALWADRESLSIGATAFTTLDGGSQLGPGHVDVRLSGGHLRACGLVLGSRRGLNGLACGVVSLAALRGRAHGYVLGGDTVYRPWYGVGAGLVLGSTITGPFGWLVDTVALAPLQRESFSVRPFGAAFRTPPVGFTAIASVQLKIN